MKRLPIKYVRDRAKSAYEKKSECHICGATQELELHHFTPLTRLFELWCMKNKYRVETDEDILAIRDQFITENHEAIYVLVVTLCAKDHEKLHKIYGKSPAITTSLAQARWVDKQRIKCATRVKDLASGET